MAMMVSINKLHQLWPILLLKVNLLLILLTLSECKPHSCEFNQLCLCQNYTAQYSDVTCINVPLVALPDFSQFQKHLYRIRLIGVGELTQIPPGSFDQLSTLASLTISKSGLSYINPDAFSMSAIRHTLSTVDLSYGNLMEVPTSSLTHLHQLQWLSLKANRIEVIKNKDLAPLKSLRTLLLNENWLSILEDRTFQQLTSLELIDFDGNMIERVEGNPFPASLKSLVISNCLLRKIPFGSLQNLVNLQALQLRGNLITHLSPFRLPKEKVDLIDLSHNLISNLPKDLFWGLSHGGGGGGGGIFYPIVHSNTTQSHNHKLGIEKISISELTPKEKLIEIRNLHLDFNFIQSIPDGLFRSVTIEKLTLSSNRINSQLIGDAAFQGPLENGLLVLDLNYNLIDQYPNALKSLRALKKLLLKNNRIKQIDVHAFHNCAHTLEGLDLSQNLLHQIPKDALAVTRKLVKVNLHDNLITTVTVADLHDWCYRLRSLILSKNSLVSIAEDSFRSCEQLNELRLGGNRLLQFNSFTLFRHLNALQLVDLSSLHNIHETFFTEKLNNNNNDSVLAMTQVKWLQLDFNAFKFIPNSVVQLFPSLMYFDLQHNRISVLSNELSKLDNLTSIILSNNNLTTVSSGTFSKQVKLENVALYFNRIATLQRHAFQHLPKLHSVVLSKNQINLIEPEAFYNVSTNSSSLSVMLDENQLRCLSANSFRHIDTQVESDRDFALYLNVSGNQIETFANCFDLLHSSSSGRVLSHSTTAVSTAAATTTTTTETAGGVGNQARQTLPVRVLDVSFNRITQLTVHFFVDFCGQALSVFANNNEIRTLPVDLLGLCPQLQTLSLNGNRIRFAVDQVQMPLTEEELQLIGGNYTVVQTSLQIQTLSLRQNEIKELTSFEKLFRRLPNLKWLDLSDNQIEMIPLHFLNATSLVKLNLAHNQLTLEEDGDKCFGIGHTLKYLDITYNSLRTLSNRLTTCHNLIELLASNNQIKTFDYITPLAGTLSQLQRLELFQNPLGSGNILVSFNLFNNHSMLLSLKLNDLNIGQLDELNVPYLYRLELCGNSISSISSKVLSRSRNIRHLNLAVNQLHEVPKHIWKYMTRLRHLDLHENPIDMLDSSSFAGLKYLKYLDIRGLNLQYIDSRIFLHQSQLATLKINTYPSIRSFRLQDILSKSDALKKIEIEVQESILSHQIQWAFGGKLRELVLTGHNLVRILPDAFQGLNNANDLTLRISNTSIKQLPEGLLKYLADIRYITIDLRSNQLETVSPGVFFNSYTDKDSSIKTWQSRQLLGGIILQDNPLQCDCNLLWISKWMKEIFAEMKSINIEAAIHIKSSLALSQCRIGGAWSKWTERGGIRRHVSPPEAAPHSNSLDHSSSHQLISVIQLMEEQIDLPCMQNGGSIVVVHKISYKIMCLLLLVHVITFCF